MQESLGQAENNQRDKNDERIISLAKENMELLRAIKESKTIICTKPWTSLEERTIEGDIKPCCWFKHFIGRVTKEEDILEIWNGNEMKMARKLLLKGDISQICRFHCPILHHQLSFDKEQLYEYSIDELKNFDLKFLENRKRAMEAIVEKKVEVDVFPLRIKLHPTNKCNLRCIMCFIEDREQRVEKEWYFGKIFGTCKDYLEELKVFGGEPLFCELSKGIIFSENPCKQIHYSFITNGTLLTEKNINKLESARIGWIGISLDSCIQITYEKIRRGSSFFLVYKNIQNLVEFRDNHNIRRFDIYANFVIQKLNYLEIADFVSFCSSLRILPNFTITTGPQSCNLLEMPYEEVENSIEKGLNRAKELGSKEALWSLDRTKATLTFYVRKKGLKWNRH